MNRYTTPIEEHYRNFDNKVGNMLPAFIVWNSISEDFIKINPKKNELSISQPENFGDNWSDDLDKNDKEKIKKYFQQFDQIKSKFGFLSFKIGKS